MTRLDIVRVNDHIVEVRVGTALTDDEVVTAVLDATGALLIWTIDDPGLFPSAVIDDVEAAAKWAWLVYDMDTVYAIMDCYRTGRSHQVVAEPSELTAPARRLAVGYWATRWWPTSTLDNIPTLNHDLLGLELASLSYHCETILETPDDAENLTINHRNGIAILDTWTGPGTHQAHEILTNIHTIADNTDTELHTHRTTKPTPDTYALAASPPPHTTGRPITSGTVNNDWRRYPPGFVDTAEDAITWQTWAKGPDRHLDITAVSPDPPPISPAKLAADIRVNDTAERIRLDLVGDTWNTRTAIPNTVNAHTKINVVLHLPGFGTRHTSTGREHRDRVRRYVQHRLSNPPPDAFLAEIYASRS